VRQSRAQHHEFLDPDEWESWGALMMLHRSVTQSLDAALRRAHGLAVTEFDVLITLFNAPGQRLGMSALAERVLLSPAGTTHLVTRLERDGLVRREVDSADRRKWFTVLTEEGDLALQAARRTHNDVLRRTLLAATSATERRTMRRVWHRLSAREPTPVSDPAR
jgi:DNA-binding MarR family transcriptional regulator